MSNLNTKNSFIRILNFGLLSSIKSIKMYLFFIILPFLVYIVVYLYSSSFDKLLINPAIMLSKLMFPSIFAIFFGASLMCDWNNSMLLKFLNMFKLNKIKYIMALFTIILILDICSTLIFFVSALLFDLFLTNQSMINAIKLESYLHMIQEQSVNFVINFRRIFGIIFTFIMSFIINFLIAYAVSNVIKQPVFVQIINIIIVIFILFMSDLVISPNNAEYNNAIMGIGYLVPQKYLTWLLFLFYIDIQSELAYINFIINNLFSHLFITNYLFPILMSFGFATLLIMIQIDYKELFKRRQHEKTINNA